MDDWVGKVEDEIGPEEGRTVEVEARSWVDEIPCRTEGVEVDHPSA